jgi:hypothetical protein
MLYSGTRGLDVAAKRERFCWNAQDADVLFDRWMKSVKDAEGYMDGEGVGRWVDGEMFV